jgi:hypothetical protein
VSRISVAWNGRPSPTPRIGEATTLLPQRRWTAGGPPSPGRRAYHPWYACSPRQADAGPAPGAGGCCPPRFARPGAPSGSPAGSGGCAVRCRCDRILATTCGSSMLPMISRVPPVAVAHPSVRRPASPPPAAVGAAPARRDTSRGACAAKAPAPPTAPAARAARARGAYCHRGRRSSARSASGRMKSAPERSPSSPRSPRP